MRIGWNRGMRSVVRTAMASTVLASSICSRGTMVFVARRRWALSTLTFALALRFAKSPCDGADASHEQQHACTTTGSNYRQPLS